MASRRLDIGGARLSTKKNRGNVSTLRVVSTIKPGRSFVGVATSRFSTGHDFAAFGVVQLIGDEARYVYVNKVTLGICRNCSGLAIAEHSGGRRTATAHRESWH